MPEFPADDDPAPVPPVRPSSDDCCRGACNPCIFDLYEEAAERYRTEMDAWQIRRTSRNKQ